MAPHAEPPSRLDVQPARGLGVRPQGRPCRPPCSARSPRKPHSRARRRRPPHFFTAPAPPRTTRRVRGRALRREPAADSARAPQRSTRRRRAPDGRDAMQIDRGRDCRRASGTLSLGPSGLWLRCTSVPFACPTTVLHRRGVACASCPRHESVDRHLREKGTRHRDHVSRTSRPAGRRPRDGRRIAGHGRPVCRAGVPTRCNGSSPCPANPRNRETMLATPQSHIEARTDRHHPAALAPAGDADEQRAFHVKHLVLTTSTRGNWLISDREPMLRQSSGFPSLPTDSARPKAPTSCPRR